MTEQFLNGKVTLHAGDCLDVLARLDECSIDSVVTDPPYHLTSIVKRFGGEDRKAWEAINGNHGGGASPYQRSSVGFMGRTWDGGDIAFRPETWRAVYRVLKPGAHLLAFGGTRTYHRMACAIEDAGFDVRDCIQWLYGSGFPKSHNVGNGWGTALKPALEPICMARKPLGEDTVAANVLKWGTGAINIDRCRVGTAIEPTLGGLHRGSGSTVGSFTGTHNVDTSPKGRWPANVIHDGSEEVTAAFPETGAAKSQFMSGGWSSEQSNAGWKRESHKSFEGSTRGHDDNGGSVARFFYSAKADSNDRIGSKHPTVKPVDLMQYLVRLVCPQGGTVLDPFSGTGTTGEAAWREGMRAVLIEAEPEYQADIRRRMALALAGPDERVRESIKARGEPIDYGPLFAALREAAE